MIKAILIDDEPLAIEITRQYLQQHSNIEVVGTCNNGFEGFKAIQQLKPDVVFLDVQMPKLTGFEMLELVEDRPAVIFTTAFDEYALKAFEANAVDYLLKPFTQERFDKAVQKLPVLLENKGELGGKLSNIIAREELNRVAVSSGSNIRIIPVQDIVSIEAYDDYVKIHTADDTFLKKQTMNHFGENLPKEQFLRVHRSYIIQLQQITKIETAGKDSHLAVLRSGIKVPLSRNGYSRLKEALGL